MTVGGTLYSLSSSLVCDDVLPSWTSMAPTLMRGPPAARTSEWPPTQTMTGKPKDLARSTAALICSTPRLPMGFALRSNSKRFDVSNAHGDESWWSGLAQLAIN